MILLSAMVWHECLCGHRSRTRFGAWLHKVWGWPLR